MKVSPRPATWPISGEKRTFCPTTNLCAGIPILSGGYAVCSEDSVRDEIPMPRPVLVVCRSVD